VIIETIFVALVSRPTVRLRRRRSLKRCFEKIRQDAPSRNHSWRTDGHTIWKDIIWAETQKTLWFADGTSRSAHMLMTSWRHACKSAYSHDVTITCVLCSASTWVADRLTDDSGWHRERPDLWMGPICTVGLNQPLSITAALYGSDVADDVIFVTSRKPVPARLYPQTTDWIW